MKIVPMWLLVLLAVAAIFLLGAGLVLGVGIAVVLIVKNAGKKKNKAEEVVYEEG